MLYVMHTGRVQAHSLQAMSVTSVFSWSYCTAHRLLALYCRLSVCLWCCALWL